jgi:transcriptional regulator with XRE-family HTH domain
MERKIRMRPENPLTRWFSQQSQTLTQTRLARELGIDRGALGWMLREDYASIPSLETALKIEKRTGIKPARLYAFIVKNRAVRESA